MRFPLALTTKIAGYIIGHNDFHNTPSQAVEFSPQLGDDAINALAAVQAR